MSDANTAARIADAEQARQALDRWLGPAFAEIERDYADRIVSLAASEPWADKKIAKVAIGLKIAREVRRQIEAVVADGKVARAEHAHARQIEAIPVEKRRMLGLGR